MHDREQSQQAIRNATKIAIGELRRNCERLVWKRLFSDANLASNFLLTMGSRLQFSGIVASLALPTREQSSLRQGPNNALGVAALCL